jgi:two-component sensor histidine kinase
MPSLQPDRVEITWHPEQGKWFVCMVRSNPDGTVETLHSENRYQRWCSTIEDVAAAVKEMA